MEIMRTTVKPKNFKNIIVRIAVITGIGISVFLIPTKTLIEIYYRNNPEFVEIYKQSIDDPNNAELYEKLQHERKQMNK